MKGQKQEKGWANVPGQIMKTSKTQEKQGQDKATGAGAGARDWVLAKSTEDDNTLAETSTIIGATPNDAPSFVYSFNTFIMKRIIAIPVDKSGMLDAHFGHCKYFAIISTSDNEIVSEEFVVPPPHEPGLLPNWLADKGVTEIIAGGMGQRAIQIFNQRGVNAFVGAPKALSIDIAKGFLDGSIQFQANYCDH